ncbi:MATH domain and coiled-coil domain-containing protein At3g58200-like isoform X2 [Tasmannia lanceolata]|uniref:MATH domain and coiled-coil domain-containing protein At3g58200-like isoform X2 n=1 Tax=Tasmannia lanceolata TaxID=3420 RepID=UPI0040642F9D
MTRVCKRGRGVWIFGGFFPTERETQGGREKAKVHHPLWTSTQVSVWRESMFGGSRSMEVTKIEASNGKVRWTIINFSAFTDRLQSDSFLISDCNWNVLIYPKVNNKEGQFSIYLHVADSTGLPDGWTRDVKFSLAVIDQLNNMSTIKNGENKFTAEKSSWGFPSFMSLTELHDPAKGYIVNDTCVVEVEFTVPDVVPKKQVESFMLIKADVKEYRNSYAFLVEMPGLKLDDIKVQLVDSGKALLVSSDQKREEEDGVKYLRADRRLGNLTRKFSISEDMNTDAISAIYKDGMLIVTIDKLEAKTFPKNIKVELGFPQNIKDELGFPQNIKDELGFPKNIKDELP